jgi:hypothetical protein
MRLVSTSLVAASLVLGAAAGGALAQEPAASPSAEAPPPSDDTINSLIGEQGEPAPGSYTYNPQGRRDPFVSLQRPVAAEGGKTTRKPGMEGFLIQEVALKGIVKTAGGGLGPARSAGFIALLLGPDGKSYPVNVGQRLFDGVITAMDAGTVTFRQEITDPLSPVRTRDVKKTLNPSEEARQ